MGPFRQADLITALDVVANLGDVSDVGAFASHLVAGLQRLIPADAVAYTQIDLLAQTAVAVVDPPEIMFATSEEALARYGAQNPLVAHAAREPHTRALKVSDFMSRREFRRTDIYDYLFRPAGLEFQMACGLPGRPGLVVGISINRSTRDFSERDRALLDLLRPHLVQAYDRIVARELSQTTISVLESAIGGSSRAAIVLSSSGAIHAASPQALRWLDEYFRPTAERSGLPAQLAARQERRQAAIAEGATEAVDDVIEVRRNARCLTVRVVCDPEAEHDLLIFEERPDGSSDQLKRLGLTPRQAEVLALVAGGQSDSKIAQALSISQHTVGKHLEHIFTRLNVTTRTAAAAIAWEATR